MNTLTPDWWLLQLQGNQSQRNLSTQMLSDPC